MTKNWTESTPSDAGCGLFFLRSGLRPSLQKNKPPSQRSSLVKTIATCYCNSPNFTKLKKKLANDKVAISSTAFAEFLTRYNNEVGTIRRVCTCMRQNHINVINDDYITFDDNIIVRYRKINQKDFNKEFDAFFPDKVRVESRYCSVIFFMVLVCTTIFECKIDPYNVPNPLFVFLSDVYKETLTPIFNEIFCLVYTDAYKTDDAENYIRHKFYELLNLFISLLMPVFQNLITEIDKTNEGEIIDLAEILRNFNNEQWELEMSKYQSKINKKPTPVKFINISGLKYGKEINDKHLKALLSGLEKSLIKTIKSTPVREYVYHIISNCISSGGTFCKNDINDAFILSNIIPNNIILSFDKGVISYLDNNADKHTEYNNSLQYIKSFYK